jgi:hypothetical protein
VPYSTLSIIRGWTVPTLYGERLSLGTYFTRGRARGQSDTLTAVHPFAEDRDRYYQFSGGDTVAVLHAGPRNIPLVRVRVRPHFTSATPLAAFDGEIDLDGDRMQIVRMRGQFVVVGARETASERLLRVTLGVTAVAYIEFVNAEVAGRYWLPAVQRTEFQAGFAILGQSRPIFRLVSTIRDIAVDTTGGAATSADTAGLTRVTISWAAADSISAFHDWATDLGSLTSSVSSDDFADLAPDVCPTTGPPRLVLFPNATERIFRFNRVEGLYLGAAPTVDFRSLVPGMTAGLYGGWAFTEQTARGGAFANYHRNETIYGVRAERTLASTNDFAPPYSEDPGLNALLGSVDDYDYVDRDRAVVSWTRTLGSINTGIATIQLGGGRDRTEEARLTKGLFGPAPFRPNRGAATGSYAVETADLEWHPNVTGDFVTPGIGARVHEETGSGQLNWNRAEVGASAREYVGPVVFALHADGGAVFGARIPPQQLFELGGREQLPGYTYKEFAGDRAILVRSFASYGFNLWKKPLRIRNYYLPGLSPGILASIAGGWTEISSAAAQRSVLALGTTPAGDPLSAATHGVRATAGAGLSFFSDLVHVGFARPIDRPGPWKLSAGFGASF